MLKNIFKFAKNNRGILIIAFILAIASAFVIFRPEYDLTTYKQMMNTMKQLIFKELLSYISYRGEIISMFYFYLMSMASLQNYIQVIPTFIFYLIIFYIIFDYNKENGYNKKNAIWIALLIFSLYKYNTVVCGIRNSLSFAIFILALYLDTIKNKKRKTIYSLNILACLIHTSLIPIFILRELTRIKNKKIIISIAASIILIIIFLQGPIVNLLKLTNIEFLLFIAERIELYLLQNHNYFNIQYIFRVMHFITLTIFSAYSIINFSKNKRLNESFLIFSIITICLVNKYWIFLRFVDFSLLLSIIPMVDLLGNNNKKYINTIVYLGMFLMIIVGIRIQIPTFVKMFIK